MAFRMQGGTIETTAVPTQFIMEAYFPRAAVASSEGYDQSTELNKAPHGTMKMVIETRVGTANWKISTMPMARLMTARERVLQTIILRLGSRLTRKIPMIPDASWTELTITGVSSAKFGPVVLISCLEYTTMKVTPQNCLKRARWQDRIFFLLISFKPLKVAVTLFPISNLPFSCRMARYTSFHSQSVFTATVSSFSFPLFSISMGLCGMKKKMRMACRSARQASPKKMLLCSIRSSRQSKISAMVKQIRIPATRAQEQIAPNYLLREAGKTYLMQLAGTEVQNAFKIPRRSLLIKMASMAGTMEMAH